MKIKAVAGMVIGRDEEIYFGGNGFAYPLLGASADVIRTGIKNVTDKDQIAPWEFFDVEIRTVSEAERALLDYIEDINNFNPIWDHDGYLYCVFCGAYFPARDDPHVKDCLYQKVMTLKALADARETAREISEDFSANKLPDDMDGNS